MNEVTFKIEKHIAVITEYGTGWNKELNIVSWNGGEAKYDIRDWSPDHTQMGRGITLKADEMSVIVNALLSEVVPPEDDEPDEDEKDDESEPEEPTEQSEESPTNMVRIKQKTGVMNLDLVQFVFNRPLKDIGDLVRKVIKPSVNREEVVAKCIEVSQRIISATEPTMGDKNAEKKVRKATRLAELVAPLA